MNIYLPTNHFKGIKLLIFPCKQFGKEAPDGIENVDQDQHADIGDIFGNIDIKGDNIAPLYKYLKKEQSGFLILDGITWSFTKFFIDKYGKPVERFKSSTDISSVEEKTDKLFPISKVKPATGF